jgi:ABC-2 type transport system permease protein
MRAFKNHFNFEFKTGIRDKNLLLLNYLFPLGLYIMLGFLMKNINTDFIKIIIPSMIVISILISTVLGLPDPLVKARDAGIFRSYKINGVPAASIVFIPPMTIIMHMVIVAIIIVPTAFLLFKAPLPKNWYNFILIFLLTIFVHSGLGVLIGVASSSSRSTILWSQLIFLPSMIIGGFFIPQNLLSDTLKKIGLLLPSTHAVNLFKYYSYNQPIGYNPLWSLIILLAVGVLAFGLAIFLFNWDSKNKTRRGHPSLAFIAIIPLLIAAIFYP